MRTVRRLLYRDIVASVAFVAVAFLALFYFIDFVDELEGLGRRGRTLAHVALLAALEVPGHFYDLIPIAVLIGTIYALARMAQSTEYTILRTSGLGPGRALSLLAVLGVLFGGITFVIGDYVAPASEQLLVRIKAEVAGGLRVGGAGAWLKERRATPDGERSVSVNIGGTTGSGLLSDVLIFEFDHDGRLVRRIGAREARVQRDGTWVLREAITTSWPEAYAGGGADDSAAGSPAAAETGVVERSHRELAWPSALRTDVVDAAVLPLATMTTADLWRYTAHLSDQDQDTQRHAIRFWNKAVYPFACLVMVALALPFAYLHARSGGVSLKVFGGIMLGISFVLLNRLAGHLGLLRDWTPWVAAAMPSLVYLLMSMAAFAWLVRYR